MLPPIGNGTLHAILVHCRAAREACERYLVQRGSSRENLEFVETIRCVALLSVIADTLEADSACPVALTDAAIELARELPDDPAGCAAACRAAADALSEWLDGTFERG